MLSNHPMQDQYDLDVLVYNNALKPDHILNFGQGGRVNKRQKRMYELKRAFTAEGLKNGFDYLFLNSYNINNDIQVWFKDKTWTSFFAIKLLGNKSE